MLNNYWTCRNTQLRWCKEVFCSIYIGSWFHSFFLQLCEFILYHEMNKHQSIVASIVSHLGHWLSFIILLSPNLRNEDRLCFLILGDLLILSIILSYFLTILMILFSKLLEIFQDPLNRWQFTVDSLANYRTDEIVVCFCFVFYCSLCNIYILRL